MKIRRLGSLRKPPYPWTRPHGAPRRKKCSPQWAAVPPVRGRHRHRWWAAAWAFERCDPGSWARGVHSFVLVMFKGLRFKHRIFWAAIFWPFFFLVRACVLSLFPPFPQMFPFFWSLSVVRVDFSLVSVSLPRFLLCFSWLHCSLTGCLRFSAGFSGCFARSMGFIDATRSSTASFLGCCYLLLYSMVCGHWSYSCVICLHSLEPFFLCFLGHQNGFRSTKNAWRPHLQKSCCQIKCMDIVFKDVILLQNGVLHCKLYSSSR